MFLDNISLENSDFVYFDPPYSHSLATYNERNKWNNNDDLRLLAYCAKINQKGIKFGISNILLNKYLKRFILSQSKAMLAKMTLELKNYF